MRLVAAIVAVLLLAEAGLAVRLVADRVASPQAAPTPAAAGKHPCNHGYEVSRAAHAKKGKSTKDAGCSPKPSGSAPRNRSGNDSDNDSDS